MSTTHQQSYTFLFTDIEGSTRLWERYPTAMGEAIARQEQILRDAVVVRGGTVFNTAGDSVCAVFPAADRAIAAAIDGQCQLIAEPWETYAPGLKIAVRMAVDAGNAEASGGNFAGPVLNRLHRLMKTGHGGQILCTVAIASDHLGPELRLRDLGSHPLRDIAGETQLFQIVAPGLPVSFPPLVTERARPRRLPLPPITLFGRARELDEIDALLRERTARLVTLLGPGGVGKTSLALALGRQLFDAFPDGVHFVDLSALRDEALVVPAIAEVLEVEDPLLNPEDALLSRLKERSLLLVLDNCEQVVDAVANVVRRLVGETDSVTVLTTSRVPLRLRGEREIRIEPLRAPTPTEDPASNPAVQLFTDQARQVDHRFVLNDTAQPAVIDICRLVDGLPLAIELAAAWVRILDPVSLRNRLAEGTPLLKSDARDRPERHRTLTSTIDWSYQLLSPEAQWAFGRLAVFQGGIPIDGALAVLQDGERASFVEALELIDTLVQANLVQFPVQTTDGPRYGMLQTIREFGLTTLSGDEQIAAHCAQSAYFAAMTLAAEEQYRSPEAAVWFDRLDENIGNLRAAVIWLATRNGGDPEASLRMATELYEFLDVRNRHQDIRTLLTLALDAAQNAPAKLRARGLAQMGNVSLSNYEQAETFYRRSLDVAATDSDNDWQMAALLGLGSVALLRGNYDVSLSVSKKVLSHSRTSNDLAAMAHALLSMGDILQQTGRPDEALVHLSESLSICEQIGDDVGVFWAQKVQAMSHLDGQRVEESERLLRLAIAGFENFGETITAAFCQADLAKVLLVSDPDSAADMLADAVDTLIPVADAFLATHVLDTGASVLIEVGDPETALELLGAASIWRLSTGTVIAPANRGQLAEVRHRVMQMVPPPVAASAIRRGEGYSLQDALLVLQLQLRIAKRAVAGEVHSRAIP